MGNRVNPTIFRMSPQNKSCDTQILGSASYTRGTKRYENHCRIQVQIGETKTLASLQVSLSWGVRWVLRSLPSIGLILTSVGSEKLKLWLVKPTSFLGSIFMLDPHFCWLETIFLRVIFTIVVGWITNFWTGLDRLPNTKWISLKY